MTVAVSQTGFHPRPRWHAAAEEESPSDVTGNLPVNVPFFPVGFVPGNVNVTLEYQRLREGSFY